MSLRTRLTTTVPLIFASVAIAASLYSPSRREESPSSMTFSFANGANVIAANELNIWGSGSVFHVANVEVDGHLYEVQLDTERSDFWLNTQNNTFTSAVNDTNTTAPIVYSDGATESGEIFLAPVGLNNGSFPVRSQAFIRAPSGVISDNTLGVIGLSSANISRVSSALANDISFKGAGLPILYNIFATYPNVSRYITFILNRSPLGMTEAGFYSIGGVNASLSCIVNQTQIPVVTGSHQWVGTMDAIIVNGKNITGSGNTISNTTVGKPLALLGSSVSLGALPPHYWNAIYNSSNSMAGNNTADLFSVPCGTKANVSVVFNGAEYPINPIDLTRLFTDSSNQTICVNAFQPLDNHDQDYDVILGDVFMRNVYTLFNYGSWVTPGDHQPYVQFLSLTNQSEAWAEFDNLNTIRQQQWKLKLNNSMSSGSSR